MRKKLRFGLIVLVLALLMAACGGGATKPPSTEKPAIGQLQFAVEPGILGAEVGDELNVTLKRGATVDTIETKFPTSEHVFYRNIEVGTWTIIVEAPAVLGARALTTEFEIREDERTLVWWRVRHEMENIELNVEQSQQNEPVVDGMLWPIGEGDLSVFDFTYEWRYGNTEEWTASEGTFSIEVEAAEKNGDTWHFTRLQHQNGRTNETAEVTYNETTGEYVYGPRTLDFENGRATLNDHVCSLEKQFDGQLGTDVYVMDCSGVSTDLAAGTITWVVFKEAFAPELGRVAAEFYTTRNGLYVWTGREVHPN